MNVIDLKERRILKRIADVVIAEARTIAENDPFRLRRQEPKPLLMDIDTLNKITRSIARIIKAEKLQIEQTHGHLIDAFAEWCVFKNGVRIIGPCSSRIEAELSILLPETLRQLGREPTAALQLRPARAPRASIAGAPYPEGWEPVEDANFLAHFHCRECQSNPDFGAICDERNELAFYCDCETFNIVTINA